MSIQLCQHLRGQRRAQAIELRLEQPLHANANRVILRLRGDDAIVLLRQDAHLVLVQAANHQRVMGRDDQLALLGADVLLEQLQVVVGPHRVEVRVGFVEEVQRLVVLREEQQAEHGQELLLTFAHLRELDARAVRALDGDAHLVDQVAQEQTLQVAEQRLRVLVLLP